MMSFWSLALVILAAGGSPQEIRIGLAPERNIFEQVRVYRPLERYLEAELDLEIELTVARNYRDLLRRFRDGELEAAFFGSLVGTVAIDRLGAIPLARPFREDTGSSYRSFLLTRSGEGHQRFEDLRGARVALVDKGTTAGWVFPLAYLRERGYEEPEDFFSEVLLAGSHDAAIRALEEGRVDAAWVKDTVYLSRVPAGNAGVPELAVMTSSAAVPSNTLMVVPSVAPGLRRALREALLALPEEASGRDALRKLRALRFVETKGEEFDEVRRYLARAGIAEESFVEETP